MENMPGYEGEIMILYSMCSLSVFEFSTFLWYPFIKYQKTRQTSKHKIKPSTLGDCRNKHNSNNNNNMLIVAKTHIVLCQALF